MVSLNRFGDERPSPPRVLGGEVREDMDDVIFAREGGGSGIASSMEGRRPSDSLNAGTCPTAARVEREAGGEPPNRPGIRGADRLVFGVDVGVFIDSLACCNRLISVTCARSAVSSPAVST